MSGPYPRGQALVTACSSGQGTIVIVEGETSEEDAYFYGRWFGERGRDVSFFPQNGWKKVVDAVTELRQQLPAHREIFGIIDRDFAPDTTIQQQAQYEPCDHVFRTTRFTVENYLLEPDGWLKVAQTLTRAASPAGCQTVVDVQAKIDDAYKRCMELAAFNYTVREEYDRQPGGGLEYKNHPKAMRMPEAELLDWGRQRGVPAPLDQKYQQHKAMIQALPQAEWPKWITGKAVLTVFLEDFKVFLRGFAIKRVQSEVLKSIYIDKHPDPPADIALLIDRIVGRRGTP